MSTHTYVNSTHISERFSCFFMRSNDMKTEVTDTLLSKQKCVENKKIKALNLLCMRYRFP